MTAEKKQTEDGQLRPALDALEMAVDSLTASQSAHIEGQWVYAPSKYMQLFDAVSGEATNGGGAGGGSKSRPPFWVDSMDLKNEIDQTVSAWQPAFQGVPPTVGRLTCILNRSWRPQDTRSIEQITTAVQAWALQIEELLNPKPRWTLPYPCPSCMTKTVYRRDSGGEMIRQPALLVIPDVGVSCLKCRAHWPQGKLLFLGRLLGSLPDNVGD